MNGVKLIRDWGDSYLGVYVWGELVWTSYCTLKKYGTFDADFDHRVCNIMFSKAYFLRCDYE